MNYIINMWRFQEGGESTRSSSTLIGRWVFVKGNLIFLDYTDYLYQNCHTKVMEVIVLRI